MRAGQAEEQLTVKNIVTNLPRTVAGWLGTWAEAGREGALRLFCVGKPQTLSQHCRL